MYVQLCTGHQISEVKFAGIKTIDRDRTNSSIHIQTCLITLSTNLINYCNCT